MEEAALSEVPKKSWRPERGWPLFLAWMGGVVASAIFWHILVTSGGFTRRGLINHYPGTIVLLFMHYLLGFGWQAWLLFRKHPARFAAWGVMFPSIYLARHLVSLDHEVDLVHATLFFGPFIQAVIIRGVRERPWAWVTASMVALVIGERCFGPYFCSRLEGFIRDRAAAIGLNNIPTPQVEVGISMLIQAMIAAVLAWKMPPVARLSMLVKASADQDVEDGRIISKTNEHD
jgi:hypothetical protein